MGCLSREDVYRTMVVFRCPVCDEALPSIEEAQAHCWKPAETSQGAVETSSKAASIFREVDREKETSSTIAREEDGATMVFDDEMINSLLDSTDDTRMATVAKLRLRHLHGLVHELEQRLLSLSQALQHLLKAQDAQQEMEAYATFGLTPECTDKQLDTAYRRLCRNMHPDKNGGSEEAKERFQKMKDQYEWLKEHRANEKSEEDKPDGPPKPRYDPEDHDSLKQAAQDMLRDIKAIMASLKMVNKPSGK